MEANTLMQIIRATKDKGTGLAAKPVPLSLVALMICFSSGELGKNENKGNHAMRFFSPRRKEVSR